MKRLFTALLRLLGFHFAPDNHVIPVMRFGLYNRVKGPGWVWIVPFFEQARPPVKKSIYVGSFLFEEVMSKDNIPFEIRMTVLFKFEPDEAVKSAVAALVREEANIFQLIVKDYTNQGLRRLAARYHAEELTGEAPMTIIEQNLARYLALEMKPLGIAPLPSGGVLIKETIAPDKFKRGLLNAGRIGALLQTLASHHAVGNLIQQAIQAGLVTGLEDLEGNLTLIPDMESLHLSDAVGAVDHGVKAHNGHNGRNGFVPKRGQGRYE